MSNLTNCRIKLNSDGGLIFLNKVQPSLKPVFLSERGIDGYSDHRKLKIMTSCDEAVSAHILSCHITVIMAKISALLTGSG